MVRLFEILQMNMSKISYDILSNKNTKLIGEVVYIYNTISHDSVGFSMNPDDVYSASVIEYTISKLIDLIQSIRDNTHVKDIHAVDICQSMIEYLEGK